MIYLKDKPEDRGQPERLFWHGREGPTGMVIFRDRREAGKRLAKELEHYRGEKLLVLALPRGGVPVGAEIARRLAAPLDVVVARKIGAPGQPELAIGAVAQIGESGTPATVLNRDILRVLGLADGMVARLRQAQLQEVVQRAARFRAGLPPLAVDGRTVILVDDGIATGATVEAAIAALRPLAPRRIVVAVPVAPRDTLERLRGEADAVVCLSEPHDFLAIGAFYADFDQVEDAEVVRLLAESRAAPPEGAAAKGD
ncbi:MAG: phosphoribosyltransferase [Kiloniellaceae bacterium]